MRSCGKLPLRRNIESPSDSAMQHFSYIVNR